MSELCEWLGEGVSEVVLEEGQGGVPQEGPRLLHQLGQSQPVCTGQNLTEPVQHTQTDLHRAEQGVAVT